MPVSSKLVVTLLPALAVLAACSPTPNRSAETVVVPPPVPGALGAPVASSESAAVSGTTVAPGPLAAPGAPMRMSANDIVATFANNTAEGVSANGLPYALYFGQDGRERFREGDFTDVGTWQVLPDGRFCSTLARVSSNTEECYIMYRAGNAISFQRPDGVTIGNVRIVPGNPRNL